jgi:hypothetical protein
VKIVQERQRRKLPLTFSSRNHVVMVVRFHRLILLPQVETAAERLYLEIQSMRNSTEGASALLIIERCRLSWKRDGESERGRGRRREIL